jgi:hypothetical protein
MDFLRTPYPPRAGVFLFYALLCLLSASAAAPQATTVALDSGGVFRLRVTGNGFPEIKSIAMTFGYDPLRVNIGEATGSAGLPSSALGATLDTIHKTLVLTLAATSTFIIADGSSLAVIRAPERGTGSKVHSIQLNSAVVVDKSGTSLSVQVVDGGTGIRFYFHNQPVAAAAYAGRANRFVTLNGRCCGGTSRSLAPGCFILKAGAHEQRIPLF